MSNFSKNSILDSEDETVEFLDSTEFLQEEYPLLKFKKVDGFHGTFGASGLYDDLDFFFQYKHGQAKLTLGVLKEGHQVPSKMYEASCLFNISNVKPNDVEFEEMFMKLMDEILDSTDLD